MLQKQEHRLDWVDGLKGISALIVVLQHTVWLQEIHVC